MVAGRGLLLLTCLLVLSGGPHRLHAQDNDSAPKGDSWLRGKLREFRTYPILDRAYQLLDQERDEEAAAQLLRALEVDPAHRNARIQLVEVYLRLDRFADAEQQAGRLLQRDPRDGRALLLRGLAQQAQGKAQDAADSFALALQAPGLAPEQRRLAAQAAVDAALAAGRYQTALDLLQASPSADFASLYRAGLAYYGLNRFQPAVDSFREAQARATGDDERLRALASLAEAQLRAELLADAGESVERLIALGGPEPPAMRLLSQVREQQGDPAAAADPLERLADRATPEDRLRIAALRLKAGQPAQAIATVRALLAERPSAPLRNQAQWLLARAHLQQQEPEAAAAEFAEIGEDALTPALIAQWLNALVASGQLRAAADLLRQVEVRDADLLASEALIHERLGDHAQAARALERQMATAGDAGERAALAQRIAELYRRDGNTARELEFRREALNLEPLSADYHAALLQRLIALGRNDEALKLLSRTPPTGPADAAQTALRIAELNRRLGDTEGQLQALQQAVQADPDDVEYRLALVDALIAAGRFDEMRSQVEQLSRSAGGGPSALRVADALIGAGQEERAVSLLTTLANDPGSGRELRRGAYQRLGNLYFQQGRYAPAGQAFEQALAFSDVRGAGLLANAVNAYEAAGTPAAALALLERAFPFDEFAPAQRQRLTAQYVSALAGAGDIERAVNVLSRYIEAGHSDDPADLATLADLLLQQGNCPKALDSFQRLARLDARLGRPQLGLGLCYQELGQPGLAMQNLQRASAGATQLRPAERRLALNTLGYLYAETEQHGRAARRWQEALAIQFDDVTAVRAARSLRLSERGDAAARLLGRVDPARLSGEPAAQYYEERANASDDAEAGIVLMERAVSLSDNADRSLLLADRVNRQRGPEQALAHYQRALELDEANARHAAALAYAEAKLGNDAAAAELLARGTTLEPDALPLHEDLGYTLRRLHRNPQAVSAFKRVVDNRYKYPQSNAPEMRNLQRLQHRIRREIEQLENQVQAVANITYRSQPEGQSSASAPFRDNGFSGQMGLDVAYQPRSFGFRDGRIFQLFGRVFATLEDDSLDPDEDTAQAGLGARYKPFKDWNVWMSGERLVAIGDAGRDDWLLRLSASFDENTDYQPADLKWLYRTAYVDGAWAVEDAATFLSSEVRQGLAYRLGNRLAVIPLVSGTFNYVNDGPADRSKLEAGIGVSLKTWFNETEYQAFRSNAELIAEYRVPVAGNSDDDPGFLMRLVSTF